VTDRRRRRSSPSRRGLPLRRPVRLGLPGQGGAALLGSGAPSAGRPGARHAAALLGAAPGATADGARRGGAGRARPAAGALARQASPRTWLALVEHALAQKPAHGATMARLAELARSTSSPAPGGPDLSEEIQASLPRGMLSRLVGRKDQDLRCCRGARRDAQREVRALLEEVAQRSRPRTPSVRSHAPCRPRRPRRRRPGSRRRARSLRPAGAAAAADGGAFGAAR